MRAFDRRLRDQTEAALLVALAILFFVTLVFAVMVTATSVSSRNANSADAGYDSYPLTHDALAPPEHFGGG